MKKPANVDVRNLFQKFGGDAGNYQEIQQAYVSSKAQQSWPIVSAIEKAQVNAPTLKAAHHQHTSRGGAAQVAGNRDGGLVMEKSPPTAKQAPPATPSHSLFGALAAKPQNAQPEATSPSTRSPFAMLGSLAKEPERSLFGAMERAPEKPSEAPRGIFGSLMSEPVQRPTSARPAQVALNAAADKAASPFWGNQAGRQESDTLNSLFSRLMEPQGAGNVPATDLRSMFGFLNK